MNCLEFRRRCIADPDSREVSFLEHRLKCPPCARLWQRMRAFQRRLSQALEVAPPEDLVERILLRQSLDPASRRRHHMRTWLALAASVLLVVGVSAGLLFQTRPAPLDQVVTDYVAARGQPVARGREVSLDQLNDLLAEFRMTADPARGSVLLAERCRIRQRRGAYLVLGSEAGPVEVVLMPAESLEKRISIRTAGRSGVIVPCPKGSMAIVARDDAPIEVIERRVRRALHWI